MAPSAPPSLAALLQAETTQATPSAEVAGRLWLRIERAADVERATPADPQASRNTSNPNIRRIRTGVGLAGFALVVVAVVVVSVTAPQAATSSPLAVTPARLGACVGDLDRAVRLDQMFNDLTAKRLNTVRDRWSDYRANCGDAPSGSTFDEPARVLELGLACAEHGGERATHLRSAFDEHWPGSPYRSTVDKWCGRVEHHIR